MKHAICHAKFNCPVEVLAFRVSSSAVIVAAAVAVATVAVALVTVVAVVDLEVLVIHAFIQPRVAKCLEINGLQTLVLMA